MYIYLAKRQTYRPTSSKQVGEYWVVHHIIHLFYFFCINISFTIGQFSVYTSILCCTSMVLHIQQLNAVANLKG